MRKPEHLNPKAYALYERLLKLVLFKMNDGDENLLAVLANTYIDYKTAHDEYVNRGPVQAGETMVRMNPAHNMCKDLAKIIEQLSTHFGLSPKSRGERLGGGEEGKDDLDDLLK